MRARLASLPWRRVIGWAALASALPFLILLLFAILTPLPKELRKEPSYQPSTRLYDRHGVFLREVRAGDGARASWISLEDASLYVEPAILAAEDSRFRGHPGVDPLAITRALAQAITARKIVSGASTLTQQLARQLVHRPRTFRGKFREMALALRIEASLSKDEILEHYLNRVHFGPQLRGIESASRFYFDKPARELSLAEAAALASIPRGPSLYHPKRGYERLRRRQQRVLNRMARFGFISKEQAEMASREPLIIRESASGPDALHFSYALLTNKLGPKLREPSQLSSVKTTLDAGLQREVEAHIRTTLENLKTANVTTAAAVVLENASGDILAYVGSHDPFDIENLGGNDGVLALRQPGSTLKPFVYGLAFEKLGMTPASLIPDIELYLGEGESIYRPRNYDGRFHGPVRARQALASSFNVPAVYLTQALGPDRLLERLHDLGFVSLDRGPTHYGAALALGDGEVRLIELANAFATLARGGLYRDVRGFIEAEDREGEPLSLTEGEAAQILDPLSTRLITDILSDKSARISGFGERNILELPFPVAVKTGTSKAYRDNLTIGYTRDITVAVWVGNFDGSPMQGVSGITGAGPLFHQVMLSASRSREGVFESLEPSTERAEICALSGALAKDFCPHRLDEVFATGTAPKARCKMHERIAIDKRNGLRGENCSPEFRFERVFERYDSRYLAWAKGANRPIAPDEFSPHCPPPLIARPPPSSYRAKIVYPVDGSRFEMDSFVTSEQSLRIRAEIPEELREVARFIVNGHAIDPKGQPFIDWPLSPGRHRFSILPGGSGEVEILVIE